MNLKHLPDEQLLNETLFWSQKEREALSQVLWRLKEIDERILYAEKKYGSLYEYCVKGLKYSEGQASRRVAACRLLVQLPDIAEDIKNGELNLTQLNQAKTFFDDEKIKNPGKKKEILDLIKGKTTRDTEKILWELKHEYSPRKVHLTLLEETVEELKKLKAMKAHSCPDMDSLLRKMSYEVIKIWDPTVIHRNRKTGAGESRYVQSGVKAEVWGRDQAKCTNCGSTVALEIDHIHPYAAGGKTTLENLRLLCSNCNKRKSLEFFGRSKYSYKS